MHASVAAEVMCVCVCVCERVCKGLKQRDKKTFVVNNKISPLAYKNVGLIHFRVWLHPCSASAH